MTESKKAIREVAKLTLSAGIAYVSGFLPASFISTIIGEVSRGLTTDIIKKADYQKIKDLFNGIHPTQLNHDLQKLLIESIVWSIRNIELLYIENNKLNKSDYRTDRLKKLNSSIINQVKNSSFLEQTDSTKMIQQDSSMA